MLIRHVLELTAKLTAAGLMCAALAGCKEPEPPKSGVRPVRTMVVDPKPIEDDRQAVGEIRPRQESDLGFRVGGKVVSRAVDIGASVKRGDLLARIDEQDFQNKQRSAEADVASAEAVLVEVASDRRAPEPACSKKPLRREPTTTPPSRTGARAEAKLDSAKAALALAKDQLKYTELRADFDGIITAVGVEPGQVVNSGQMVVRLAKPDEIDAVFNVAEAAFRDRQPGERPAIVVNLLSSPGIIAEGIVREVSPVADPATRTYQVKVSLDKPPTAMRFGASVMGRLKATTAPVVVLAGQCTLRQDRKAGRVGL